MPIRAEAEFLDSEPELSFLTSAVLSISHKADWLLRCPNTWIS
jgi:hypothetical protein